ncbi:MAG: DNA polymerase III subunit gamma/tau [Methylophilaceae bacterium]|jgi:DNA polymerase III subunit gamma/tau|nr:MAG: DNA polymerase III subunit gamma/tau [Methylophilaceae bacterium]
MSHQVLARKWRPKSFETLVGQPHVVRALTNALEQQRIHHAYLFTGTRGVGKTTLARIIAKSLNCETGITAKPCGICNACTEIDKGRFVDLLEVDAASNTQVDAMRELLENAQYAPTSGRFKVYIIDEVHMLSKSAFNAMLKTLEEPPAHVKFILATTDPQKVPVTVLSRCLQFNLRQMASPTIIAHLQEVLTQENIPFEMAGIQLIARAAEGSMRDALSLTDQAIAYGNQAVNEADVRSMLGAIDQSYLFDIIHALINEDGASLIAKAQEMEARSISFEAALNDLAKLLHQIAIAQTVPETISHDLPERDSLLQLAQALSAEKLQLYYQIALLGGRDIGLAPDEYAGFTMSLLRMLAFSPAESNSAQKKNSENISSHQSANASSTVTQNPEPIHRSAHVLLDNKQPIDTKPSAVQSIEAKTAIDSISTPLEEPEVLTNNMPILFDGNWRKLIELHLKLGIARALAQHCEMLSYDENSITLRVAEKQKHLVSATYQEKLSSAINMHFGRKIELHFQIDSEANTPAKEQAEEKAVIQSSAEEAIMNDAFVQALINDFDAKIIPNSIKPTT